MEVQSAFAGVSTAALAIGDAFHIDDLLDFSNEDIAGPIGEGLLSSLDSSMTVSAETVASTGSPGSLTGTKHHLDGNDQTADVLCVPCDDLAELEWLSKFVEESFSMGETPTRPMTSSDGLSVSCTDMQFEYSCKDRFQSASPVSVLESSASSGRAGCNDNNNNNNMNLYREPSVPGRARSKRARTGGRVWGNSRILATAAAAAAASNTTDTESLSSDSNVISGGGGHSSALSADSSHQQRPIMPLMTPPPKAVTTVKKPWKPGKKGGSGQEAAAAQPWRCLHCATQRTPQWRAGPMGPKTLCNACGVRYKSGRLLPEYRPAGSPGYVGHKHSNSHKKILEMRRQRETTQHHHQQSMLSSTCQPSPPPLLSSSALDEDDEDPAGICTSQN